MKVHLCKWIEFPEWVYCLCEVSGITAFLKPEVLSGIFTVVGRIEESEMP